MFSMSRICTKVRVTQSQIVLSTLYSTSIIVSQYGSKNVSDQSIQNFLNIPSLHFSNEKEFIQSEFYSKLSLVLDEYFRLNRYQNNKIQTISMRDTLKILGLDSIYEEFIDDEKQLIGIHGTSLSSIPYIIPHPSKVKLLRTFQNPYHDIDKPSYFFYGNNVQMALHYSELNSIYTEAINGKSDPNYYPDRMGVLGFLHKDVIKQVNQDKDLNETTEHQKIIISETIAWKANRKGGVPDDCKIGEEIRIPTFYHSQISNLLIFGIKGNKRSRPLDQGIQYRDGKSCFWQKNEGYVEINEKIDNSSKLRFSSE